MLITQEPATGARECIYVSYNSIMFLPSFAIPTPLPSCSSVSGLCFDLHMHAMADAMQHQRQTIRTTCTCARHLTRPLFDSTHLMRASCLKLQQAFMCSWSPVSSNLRDDTDRLNLDHIQNAALAARHRAAVHSAVHWLAFYLLLGDVMDQPACTVTPLSGFPQDLSELVYTTLELK